MCITRKYVIFTGPSVNNYNFWNYMNSRVNKEKNREYGKTPLKIRNIQLT